MKYSCKCKKIFTIIYPEYESSRTVFIFGRIMEKMRPIISLILENFSRYLEPHEYLFWFLENRNIRLVQ